MSFALMNKEVRARLARVTVVCLSYAPANGQLEYYNVPLLDTAKYRPMSAVKTSDGLRTIRNFWVETMGSETVETVDGVLPKKATYETVDPETLESKGRVFAPYVQHFRSTETGQEVLVDVADLSPTISKKRREGSSRRYNSTVRGDGEAKGLVTRYEGSYYVGPLVEGVWGAPCPESALVTLANGDRWPHSQTCATYHGGLAITSDCVYADLLGEYVETEAAEEDDELTYSERHGWYLAERQVECESCGEVYPSGYRSSCDCPDPRRINNYSQSGSMPYAVRKIGRRSSKWLLGTEVEKNSILGRINGEVVPQPLFAGWVQDGSCGVDGGTGVEGLTHLYPLDDSGEKQLSADIVASPYVDEKANGFCGGHINLSRDNQSIPLEEIKPYLGLIYSLWRYRLTNQYCYQNKRLTGDDESDYAPVTIKDGRTEFRLVSGLRSGVQLLWRFKMFRYLSESIDSGVSFAKYLEGAAPLLEEPYGPRKLKQRLHDAHLFQMWINTASEGELPAVEIARFTRNEPDRNRTA